MHQGLRGDGPGVLFVDRIIAQAAVEGQPLSESERRMLSFSESDSQFVVDPALVEQVGEEISDEDYEAKVAGLIDRSCELDVASNGGALESYRAPIQLSIKAITTLLIVLKRGLARWLRPWWAFWQ